MLYILTRYCRKMQSFVMPLNVDWIVAQTHLSFKANVAKGKPALQSSTGPWGGVASRGNDGNPNPQWKAKSCTATNKQARPWWRVDLQGIFTIGKVKLVNRQDCCSHRLRNLQVRIGKDGSGPDRNILWVFSLFNFYPETDRSVHHLAQLLPKRIVCDLS